MYQVNLGNKILYYPASEDAVIYDTELNEEIGLAGEFTFKVPPQNPLYSELTQGALVTILKDNVEVWRGEIRNIDTDFAKIASVYCLEDLAWLADEYLTPALITNEPFAQRFQTVIGAYNASRSSERQFAVGYITNVDSSDNCTWQTEYDQSILDCLRSCICQAGTTTGYIRVRRVTSGGVVTRYIDIVRLADYGSQTAQPIEYGYNLLDYVKESDYSNLVNLLTPYGDDLDSEIYEGYSAKLQGDTITNTDSVNIYGRHAKAVVFDGVTDVNTLNALAAAYLTRYSQPQLTMEVEAVDLSAVESVDEITIGDSIRIIAQPFAVDQWLYLTQIKRDIQNIDKNSITLSGYVRTGRTITSQAQQTTEAVKNIPSKASILDAARKNALEILNGVDGGYVTFETNANDQITELRIANNMDYTQATKCWRWNIGGLAYLERENPADKWTVTTAATMDGGFVADFITTGNLTLGNGGDNDAPLLQAYSGDTLVTRINRGGLYAIAGEIAGFTLSGSLLSSVESGSGYTASTYIGPAQFKYNYKGSGWPTDSYIEWSRTNGYLEIQQGHHQNHGGLFVRKRSGDYAGYTQIMGEYILTDEVEAYTFTERSDERLKEDIKTVDTEVAQSIISKLRPVTYRAKKNPKVTRLGLIAQELRSTIDEVIPDNDFFIEHSGSDGYRGIDYVELLPWVISVIQNQQEEINLLKEQINTLKGEENG